ncbi:MGMT family protein [Sporosarcina ureilytica]|uniref:DNA methyltransferase n=1 Tax=Sporosarcina ureilytica TaxID=298596 RepID=A0A1D8JCL6_9BACL|nr:MGMT family protein [Sporosarcina ureilytica]AOV06439.1 DNA methyltransferase [Sporosarcina ureilytica]
MKPFTKNVIALIQSIPYGRVATYGQIAKAAGSARAARQVSWILHSASEKYQLPWHRVINSKGEISLTASEQREMLEMEGIEFSLHGKIDLSKYQWKF